MAVLCCAPGLAAGSLAVRGPDVDFHRDTDARLGFLVPDPEAPGRFMIRSVIDPEQPLGIMVQDPDMDTDGLVSHDTVTVTVRAEPSGDIETLVLPERLEPGVFMTALELEYGAAVPGDGRLQFLGGDRIVISYRDVRNRNPGRSVVREATAELRHKGRVEFGAGLYPSDPATSVVTAPGEIFLRLKDRDLDADGLAGTDEAVVRVRTLHGDEETFTLYETAPGFFAAAAPSAVGHAVPGNGVIELLSGDEVVIEYMDARSPESDQAVTRSVKALVAFDAEIFALAAVEDGEDFAYPFVPMGGTARFVIYDPDKDTDGVAGSDTVEAVLRTTSGDVERLILYEDRVPGRFVGEIETRHSFPEPGNGIIELSGGDELVLEYRDINNVTPWTAVTLQAFFLPASNAVVGLDVVWDGDGAPKGLIPGAELRVTVYDPAMDTDFMGYTDIVEVTVATTLGDEESLTLAEGDEPGVFSGVIPTRGGRFEPGDGVIQVAGSDRVTVHYRDRARGPDAPAVVTASVPVVADGLLFVARQWGEAPVQAVNETRAYKIFLTDWTRDTDGLPGTDTAVVRVETAAGDVEDLVLHEIDQPGVFAAPLKLAYGLAVPGNGVIEIIGVDSIEFAYLDEVSAESLDPKLRRLQVAVAYDADIRIMAAGAEIDTGEVGIDQAIKVRVADPDMDTDGLPGSDTVTVELTADSGDRETLVLDEVYPGVFEGVIESAYGSFEPENSVLEYISADTIRAVYKDRTTLTGGPEMNRVATARPREVGEIVVLDAPDAEEPLSAVVARGRIHVRVVDREADTDGKPFTDEVEVVITTTSGDRERLVLSETAEAGVFSWFLPVEHGDWFDLDGVLQVVSADEITIAYKDLDDRLTGEALARTHTLPVESRTELFLVMLGNLEVGRIEAGGLLEPIGAHDKFQKGLYSQGRLAFFLKGKIKGEYLITASYDTDKPTARKQYYQALSPTHYYPIYGDTSAQGYAAETSSKLFVRVTRDEAELLIGDISTDIAQGEFVSYARTLQGVKLEYNGSDYDIKAYGAMSKRIGARDEVQGQGVSGIYYICRQSMINLIPFNDPFEEFPITNPAQFGRGYYNTTCDEPRVNEMIANSDRIVIEVRDRDHRDILIESRPLNRYEHYEIDYRERTVVFKEPIGTFDADGNPIYIIIDYEYEPFDGIGRNYYAGAAATYKGFKDGRVTLSHIIENKTETYVLTGLDVDMPVGRSLRLGGEYALADGARRGRAFRLDAALNIDDRRRFTASYRDVDSNFSNEFSSLLQPATRHLALGATLALARGLTLNAGFHDFESDDPATGARAENMTAFGGLTYAQGKNEVAGRFERRESETQALSRTEDRARVSFRHAASSRVTLAAEQEFRNKPDTVAGPKSLSALQATYRHDEKTSTTVRHQWYDAGKPSTYMGVQTHIAVEDSPNRQAYVKYQMTAVASGVRNHMLMGLNQLYSVGHYATGSVRYEKALAVGGQSDQPEALSIGMELFPNDDFMGAARYEIRRQQNATRRLITFAADGRVSNELSFMGEYRSLSAGRDDAVHRDILFALSYRSLKVDTLSAVGAVERRYRRLPLVTKTVWLGSVEGIYSFNSRVDLMGRYAFKEAENYYIDGDFVRTFAELYLTRLTYRFHDRWDMALEYSLLHQKETGSLLRGKALEFGYVFREFDSRWKLIVGRAWLDYFDEDFMEQDFWRRNWYLRLIYKY